MGSHSANCHPTQVNAPCLNPSQVGWYSVYPTFLSSDRHPPKEPNLRPYCCCCCWHSEPVRCCLYKR